MSIFYDRGGRAITLDEWAKLVGDREYKRVGRTTMPDGRYVSTVLLGLDHGFGEGPPLIFETMVFPSEGDWSELMVRRYSTLAEAVAGHAEVVAECEAGQHTPELAP